MVKSVPEMLLDSAATFEERSKVYGDNYKRFGAVMQRMFPNGLSCNSVDDFNRLGVFVQIVSKVTRYAEQFAKGGHDDSLLDLSVYATMLRELDAAAAANKEWLSTKVEFEGVKHSDCDQADDDGRILKTMPVRYKRERPGKDYSW